MRATLMLANNQPIAGNRLVPIVAQPPPNLFGLAEKEGEKPLWLKLTYSAFGLGVGGTLAYHGYKRNNSWGWAVAWGIIGGAFWPIALPVAVAQGIGKPKES